MLIGSFISAAVVATYFVNWARRVWMDTGWHEPLFIIVGCGCFTIVASLVLATSRRKKTRQAEHSGVPDARHSVYSLKELMIAATLGALMFALIAISLRRPEEVNWATFFGFAAYLGTANCLCAGIVLAPSWRWRVAAAIALIATAIVASSLLANAAAEWLAFFFFYRPVSTQIKLFYLVQSISIVTLLCGLFLLNTANFIGWRQLTTNKSEAAVPKSIPWKNKLLHLPSLAKIACLIVGVTAARILMPIYVDSARTLPKPPERAGNAATYGELMTHLAAVRASNPGESTTFAIRGLGENVAADEIEQRYREIADLINADVSAHLSLADTAPTASEETIEMTELQNMRSLARTWANEIQFSRASNDVDASVTQTLELLQFGSRIAVGGVTMHKLVGIACESVGQTELLTDLPKLNETQLQRVIDILSEIDRKREPREVVMMRDDCYMDRRLTWRSRLEKVNKLYARDPASPPNNAWSPTVQSCDEATRRRDTACRMLIIHAALGLHRKRNKLHPTALSELSPSILSTIPLDPYSGEGFLYKPDGQSFVLYSRRDQTYGIVLPRDANTAKYLWNVHETIDGQRVLAPVKKLAPKK